MQSTVQLLRKASHVETNVGFIVSLAGPDDTLAITQCKRLPAKGKMFKSR